MKRIYFLRRDDGTGPIKIGCSSDIERRVYQLGIDYRQSFTLLAIAPGGYRLERDLHLKFAKFRTTVDGRRERSPGSTEWFSPEPELLTFVEKVAASGKITLKLEDRRDLIFAKRYLNGETLQEIANDYDLTRERVRQILRAAGIASLGLRDEHRAKPHELTPNEIAAASAYRKGDLSSVVCDRFGLKRHQLLSACRRLGVEIKPRACPFRSDPEQTKKAVARLYRNGASLQEIRDQFGWSHITYVYRWLKRAGVEPNRRGDFAHRLAA